MNTNTYWNNKGKFQTLGDELRKLIPAEGSVKNPRKNKQLEKYRKACNCYYDLYNNGLYNRAREFSRVFRCTVSSYKMRSKDGVGYHTNLYEYVEKEMDNIITWAAKEQGLIS